MGHTRGGGISKMGQQLRNTRKEGRAWLCEHIANGSLHPG